MSQKDGTGPRGKGPKMGRGMGNCVPGSVQREDAQKNIPMAQRPQRRGFGGRKGNSQ